MTLTSDFSATPAPPPGALIKDSSTKAFQADVIDASVETPVLVDFWAPWCGPCRQLTPALEKVVTEFKGKLRLVKINIDENQALAGQMGIQSIPAVFAFAGGRPVDGFLGALPESEVRRFAKKLVDKAPGTPKPGSIEDEIKMALAAATEAVAAGDLGRAAQIYGAVLQHAPDNVDAVLGMTKVYIEAGDAEHAQQTLEMLPETERKGAAYETVATALRLMEEAADLSDVETLERQVAAQPDDHQARFELAMVHNAEGRREQAAEALVAIMRRDRTWNEDAARKKLLELFQAWGPKDPATVRGRRLLSALLFS